MGDKTDREVVSIDDSIIGCCISAAKGLLPVSLKRWIRVEQHRYSLRPPRGRVRFGTLKRLAPISPTFGIERGQGVDRYYIEIFLKKFIDDIRADVLEIETSRLRGAVETVFSILKPGGVLLATVPGISQISRHDMERWGEYWRFTTRSARRLLDEVFPAENVSVEAYGNVYSAVVFLHGLAVEDLNQRQLDHRDQDDELVIALRAVKPAEER